MKHKFPARLLAAAASVALLLSACSASPPALLKADGVGRVSVDRSAYPAELAQLRTSARKLGAALLTDGGEAGNGNVVASPGSLLIALAMLRAGASGKSAAEMDGALGLPAQHRDEAMNVLLASLEAFDGDPGLVDEKDPPRRRSCTPQTACSWTRACPPGKAICAPWPGITGPACTR
ncbi:serpin family protein [Arthrobacter sp. NPDC056886]|uniref:serpin family protein n=1 Tax=Arthrobacter sp. NPDC056886 TaxID=3345960 RepID=UPI003672186B